MNLQEIVTKRTGKAISQCSNEELYFSLLEMTKGMAEEKVSNEGKRKLYYISAEFLIGKLLSNNLINLGIYEDVKKLLADNGKSLAEIEEVEPEPSLGNGGLGRLAACFLDSIATLGLNGDGVGLNYHYGLFKQVFENNLQHETPNPWIEKESWLTKTDRAYTIQFGGFNLQSRMYDIDVLGYNNRTTKLHLFDVETVDESLVGEGIDFDKEDIKKNLTLFLYPDDSDDKGRILRVYQQYFMVSNAARLIIDETLARGGDLHKLNEYAVVQINDTHPSMVIPELIRLLMERGILMDEAIDIVSKTCAYTNHTILAEALEKWPIHFLEKAVPQLMPIIYELNSRVVKKFDDKSVAIIDDERRVHMAHMDIHYGYSINGVAYLHTEILKNSELNNFYKIYPEKFNNKTNGITFRRWLLHCDPELTALFESLIGDGFKKDATELEKLGAFVNDETVLQKILDVKNAKKAELKDYLAKTQGIELNENSIYDIQIKRLHEYKRQQMNALYVIHKYFEIKAGKKPARPITSEQSEPSATVAPTDAPHPLDTAPAKDAVSARSKKKHASTVPAPSEAWMDFVEFCRKNQSDVTLSLPALTQANGVFSEGVLTLATTSAIQYEQLSAPSRLSELERLASDYSGKAVSVQVSAPERLHKTEAELKKEFASHPVIKSLTETFGASLIRCIPVEHTRS